MLPEQIDIEERIRQAEGLRGYAAGDPGWKARETSRQAAEAIAPRAKGLRARVLEAIRLRPGTPEQVALRLSEPLMNVRPRCSELARASLIEDSGARATAMGGRRAIIWQAAPPQGGVG